MQQDFQRIVAGTRQEAPISFVEMLQPSNRSQLAQAAESREAMNDTRYCEHCKRDYSVYAPLATQWDHQAGRCVPPVNDSESVFNKAKEGETWQTTNNLR